ncbi:MAG: gliding motility-associated C-terminal domain-containing protein [Flavobacteriales bacterium]|nr:gliding motility-associated C-terminal domain-containing protein [Flavobacteriales bacterium]
MKRIIGTLILITLITSAKSQILKWDQAIAGQYHDVVVDTAGDVYYCGRTAVDVNYLEKRKPGGSIVWSFSLISSIPAAEIESIDLDSNQNIYVVGQFFGTMDLDPGVGVTTVTSAGGDINMFVAKYSSAGALIWGFSISAPSQGHGLTIDNMGNVLVTARYSGTGNIDPLGVGTTLTSPGGVGFPRDVFVGKYNGITGQNIWAFSVGGTSQDEGHSIATDDANNVYVKGVFNNTVDFDPGVGTAMLTAISGYDTYIAKYDSNGVYQWAFNYDESTQQSIGPEYLAVDGAGNVYSTTPFSGTQSFDPSGVNLLTSFGGTDDIALVKYSTNGSYIWGKAIGGAGNEGGVTLIVSVAIGPCGGIFITGNHNGISDFDPGPGFANLSSGGSTKSFVAKYDANGAYIWADNSPITSGVRSIYVSSTGYIGGSGSGIKFIYELSSPTPPVIDSVGPFCDNSLAVALTTSISGGTWGGSGVTDTLLGVFDPLVAGVGLHEVTYVTAGSCAGADTTYIEVDSNYVISATASICLGDSVQLPGGVYVNAAGTFTDTLSSSSGCDSVINTTVTIDSAYFVNTSASICQGDSLLLPGGTFALIAGVYVDTLNAVSCDSIVTITVTINSNYSVAAFVSICQGDSIQLPGGSYATLAGGYIDSLSTVSGCDSIINTTVTLDPIYIIINSTSICQGDSVQLPGGSFAAAAGVYIDTLSTSSGCDSIFNTTVSVNPTYLISLSALICPGDSVQLSGGAYVSAAGIYTDSLMALSGCDSVIATTVTIDLNYLITSSVSVCQGDSVLLPGGAYVNAAGVYTDSLTTFSGCDSIIVITVSIDLSYTASSTVAICLGDSLQLPGGSYVTTAGTFSDTFSTALGCDSVIITTVSLNALPQVDLGNDSTFCMGGSVTLNAGNPGATYLWQDGSVGPTLNVATSGVYFVTVTDTSNCSSTDTTSVTVNFVSDATISPVNPVCAVTAPFVLIAVDAGGLWSGLGITDSDSGIFDPQLAGDGVHEIVYTIGGNCGHADSVNIVVNNIPGLSLIAVDESCSGKNDGSVNLTITGAATPYTYLWDDAGLSVSQDIAGLTPGSYTVTVTDSNGCWSNDNIDILASSVPCNTPYVYVPNIFSPNSDGQNDVLYVLGNGITELTFVIYDRWGNKVFETTDQSIGWEGAYKGDPMNEAVFVYYLKARLATSEMVENKGNISLVR